MPIDKDRKRIIRSRMKKTGESYTTARAQVIARRTPRTPSPPPIDYAARAGFSEEKIVEKTGRTWREWAEALDRDQAASLSHREIAALVHGKHGVGDWWTQTVTVGYERIKGLREIGQRRSGQYEAAKSRTFGVPLDALFDVCANAATRRRWLDGVAAVVRTATRPKSMRLQWPDGTIVVVGFLPKGADRTVLSIQHTKLPDRLAAEKAKQYWAGRLDALGSLAALRSR
jgi:hypothetical protein